MSKIDIIRPHGLSSDEARARVSEIEPKLKSKYGVSLVWQGDKATVSGPGVSGNAWLEASQLGMSLKLGLMLRPLAGTIKRAIEAALDDALTG